MTRGDLVTVAMQGDLGKPRPALVIQSDLFSDHATVTILPVTSTLIATPLVHYAGGGTNCGATVHLDHIWLTQRPL